MDNTTATQPADGDPIPMDPNQLPSVTEGGRSLTREDFARIEALRPELPGDWCVQVDRTAEGLVAASIFRVIRGKTAIFTIGRHGNRIMFCTSWGGGEFSTPAFTSLDSVLELVRSGAFAAVAADPAAPKSGDPSSVH